MLPGGLLFPAAVIVLVHTMLTAIQGELPAFVVPVVVAQMVLFGSFGLVLLWQQLNRPSRWIYGEYAFQVLSLASKALLGVVLVVNVLVFDQYDCIFRGESVEECGM